jgi:hypothetical protein
VAFKTGIDFSFSTAATFSYALGPTFTSASNINMEADKTVSIKVDPDDTPGETMLEETIPKCAAGIAVASSALTALIALGGKYDGGEGWNRVADVHGGLLVISGALAAAKALSVMRTNKKNNTGDKPATSIDMDATSVNIQANGGNSNTKGFIALKAKSKFNENDEDAVSLDLKKAGSGPSTDSIDIQCGKIAGVKGSRIEMKHESIELIVGVDVSIKLLKDSIVFKTGSETFTMDAETGLTIAKKGIKALKGEIKSKGGTISGKLETKDLDATKGKVGAVKGG